jgi:hypothetical protein
MKNTLFCVLTLLLLATSAKAQSGKELEISIGFAIPVFYSGNELLRSEKLRQDGLSYYQNFQGNRKKVGHYNQPLGYTIGAGFLKSVSENPKLSLGLMIRKFQDQSIFINQIGYLNTLLEQYGPYLIGS